jgi:predicted metal-dependent hydrolase
MVRAMTSRDRDETGRPRNARRRDSTGRPLPRDRNPSYVEEEPPALPPDEAIDLATELFANGLAFRAHEVFEAVWKSTDVDRELWRGLAQLAVGVTHAQRGNTTGSRALLLRSAESLQPWAGRTPYGLDVDGLRAWAEHAAESVGEARRPPQLRAG